MPKPTRPKKSDILEVHELDNGALVVWYELAGHTLSMYVSKSTLFARKLGHGLSRLDDFVDEDRVQIAASELVDLEDEADFKLLQVLVEQAIDNFQDSDKDWTEHTPPLRPSEHPDITHPKLKKRRNELEKRITNVRNRKPTTKPLINRNMYVHNKEGEIILTISQDADEETVKAYPGDARQGKRQLTASDHQEMAHILKKLKLLEGDT